MQPVPNAPVKTCPTDSGQVILKFDRGDRVQHSKKGFQVEITDIQIANGRPQYRWKRDGTTEETGIAAESDFISLQDVEKMPLEGEAPKLNSCGQAPIRKIIEASGPSLPKGDEIKTAAGTLARRMLSVRENGGRFFGNSDFVKRMTESVPSQSLLWEAIAPLFDYQ